MSLSRLALLASTVLAMTACAASHPLIHAAMDGDDAHLERVLSSGEAPVGSPS